jgi:hypothetical protein
MTEKPALDPELHEDDTVVSVWRRRLVLFLLIVLVVALSAPLFSGCEGALRTKKTVATYEVAGRTYEISDEDVGQLLHRWEIFLRVGSQDPRSQQRMPEGEAGLQAAYRIMMLDAAARAEGVAVSERQVDEERWKIPAFQTAGKYDDARYRAFLSEYSRYGISHESFSEMLRQSIRVSTYHQVDASAFSLIPGDEAYAQWKKRNVRLTVEYVPSPYDLQRAKVESTAPTDEQLRSIQNLPEVRPILAVPPRKVVEVAYLKAMQMTPEQFEAAKTFATEAEIFTEEYPLETAAFRAFHHDRDTIYTKERWAKLTDPDYPRRRREYEEQKTAWDKLSKEEQEKQKAPEEPKDPVAAYPTEGKAAELEQFTDFWKDRVVRETLAKGLVEKLGADAEREGKAFADYAERYARFGVRVVRNTTPLTDAELAAQFPDDVARDSEFEQVAGVEFKPPTEGQEFKPKYHVRPAVPTTRVAEKIEDRGWMVLRLDSCDPARIHAIEEKRAEVSEVWKKHQVAEAAKAVLEEIRKKAEAANPDAAKPEVEKTVAALRAAAAEAGLEARTLRRFSRTTEAPKPPVAPPGEKLSPELQAVARRVQVRNRVQKQYQALSTLSVGKFADVVVDAASEAAILVFLVEKHEPGPLEMQDDEFRNERMTLARQAMEKSEELTGYDALAKRYSLKRYDEKPAKKDAGGGDGEAPPK